MRIVFLMMHVCNTRPKCIDKKIFREIPMSTLNQLWSPNDLDHWKKQTSVIESKVGIVSPNRSPGPIILTGNNTKVLHDLYMKVIDYPVLGKWNGYVKAIMEAIMMMDTVWTEPIFWYHISGTTWVRARRCSCLVTWFCYRMIAKPGNKTAAASWPDP